MGHDFIILATTEFWEHYGYLGLFAGSFLSALFIPLGADLLYVSMLAMGFNPWLCLFVATTGGWIGGLVIYGVGYAGNATRIRKLFHIKEEQLLKQKNKIENQLRKKYLESFTEIISQIRRRQHKVKNQFDTAFGMYRLYDNYDELVAKQKEFLGRIWDYELPTDAIVLEEPAVVALIYEKINEAIEEGIEVHTIFSCSMLHRGVSDVIWVQILGTLLDNAIEAEEEFVGQKKMWIEIQEQKGNTGKVSIYIANAYYKKSQDELEQLFEYGYSTKGEGRGIGLYDVKMLVHKNKGDLIVQNGQRDGVDCFELWIVI